MVVPGTWWGVPFTVRSCVVLRGVVRCEDIHGDRLYMSPPALLILIQLRPGVETKPCVRISKICSDSGEFPIAIASCEDSAFCDGILYPFAFSWLDWSRESLVWLWF